MRAPISAEQLVEHIYGSSWRVPNPGFNWDLARIVENEQDWVPAQFAADVHWANLYTHHGFTEASSFSEFVLSHSEMPAAVLDIGCGDGRDSHAFARGGRRVAGLDRSQIGVERAAVAAANTGLDADTAFVVGDVGDIACMLETIRQARETAAGGPLLFICASSCTASRRRPRRR